MKRSTCGCAVAADSTADVVYEYQLLLPESDPFVLAESLDGPGRERLRAEAQRNMTDNPGGFTALAVECLAGTADACSRVDRFADRPMHRDARHSHSTVSGAHDRVPLGTSQNREPRTSPNPEPRRTLRN